MKPKVNQNTNLLPILITVEYLKIKVKMSNSNPNVGHEKFCNYVITRSVAEKKNIITSQKYKKLTQLQFELKLELVLQYRAKSDYQPQK